MRPFADCSCSKADHEVAGSCKRSDGLGERLLVLDGVDVRVARVADTFDERVAIDAIRCFARGIDRSYEHRIGIAEALAEAIEQGL